MLICRYRCVFLPPISAIWRQLWGGKDNSIILDFCLPHPANPPWLKLHLHDKSPLGLDQVPIRSDKYVYVTGMENSRHPYPLSLSHFFKGKNLKFLPFKFANLVPRRSHSCEPGKSCAPIWPLSSLLHSSSSFRVIYLSSDSFFFYSMATRSPTPFIQPNEDLNSTPLSFVSLQYYYYQCLLHLIDHMSNENQREYCL